MGTVLLTGASGLGSHRLDVLLSRGFSVVALVRSSAKALGVHEVSNSTGAVWDRLCA
jgi:thioester reductase-like protein